jgi:hypothetical protein
MKRPEEHRPSLVEFLGSIKFSRTHADTSGVEDFTEHFARLQSSTRRKRRSEERQLVRSAN